MSFFKVMSVLFPHVAALATFLYLDGDSVLVAIAAGFAAALLVEAVVLAAWAAYGERTGSIGTPP